MRKSTILVIFIVYFASIILIGFFGMSLRVSDEVKYVKDIQLQVKSVNEEAYDFVQEADNELGNKQYSLTVRFSYAEEVEQEIENEGVSIIVTKKYVALNFLPEVTYDTGDVENAVEEAIVYGITNDQITQKGVAEIDEKGVLYCYKKDQAFIIRINPKSNSFNNTAIIVRVFVV